MTSRSPSFADALIAELAREPGGVSLPRLCKRLDVRMSVLLRELAWLGDDNIGGEMGPGLIRIERRGELDIAMLTDRGAAHAGAASAASS